MTASTPKMILISAIAVLVLSAAMVPAANAGRVHVTGDVNIRVWVDDTWDVFPSYDDVAVSIVAERDCYATVYVVDTDGYLHVVYPFSPYEEAWLAGGVVHRYSAYDLGLDRLDGRGIAYVFAVGSPRPFDYSPYGDAVFSGGYGYRVYGDPFIASRRFYVSLFPVSFGWDYVSVSYARFYVREWARYPRYLCRGHVGVHVRVNDYCRTCSHVFHDYRVHAADPYRVIHPRSRVKFKQADARHYAEIKRAARKFKSGSSHGAKTFDAAERVRTRSQGRVQTPPRVKSAGKAIGKNTSRVKSRVVSTSRSIKASRTAQIKSRKAAKPSVKKRVAGWKSSERKMTRSSTRKTAKRAKTTVRSAPKKPTRPSGVKNATKRSSTSSRKATSGKQGGRSKTKRSR